MDTRTNHRAAVSSKLLASARYWNLRRWNFADRDARSRDNTALITVVVVVVVGERRQKSLGAFIPGLVFEYISNRRTDTRTLPIGERPELTVKERERERQRER